MKISDVVRQSRAFGGIILVARFTFQNFPRRWQRYGPGVLELGARLRRKIQSPEIQLSGLFSFFPPEVAIAKKRLFKNASPPLVDTKIASH